MDLSLHSANRTSLNHSLTLSHLHALSDDEALCLNKFGSSLNMLKCHGFKKKAVFGNSLFRDECLKGEKVKKAKVAY